MLGKDLLFREPSPKTFDAKRSRQRHDEGLSEHMYGARAGTAVDDTYAFFVNTSNAAADANAIITSTSYLASDIGK